jgi:hypothetical protein
VQGYLPLTLSYFDSPFMVTDLTDEGDGFGAMLVAKDKNVPWGFSGWAMLP